VKPEKDLIETSKSGMCIMGKGTLIALENLVNRAISTFALLIFLQEETAWQPKRSSAS